MYERHGRFLQDVGKGKRRFFGAQGTPARNGARPPALRKRSAVTRGESDAKRRCRQPRSDPGRAKKAAGSARQGITRRVHIDRSRGAGARQASVGALKIEMAFEMDMRQHRNTRRRAMARRGRAVSGNTWPCSSRHGSGAKRRSDSSGQLRSRWCRSMR
ncbi:hypothetical protein LC55x_3755 [Lysobacter capsici]|nr:hypothetical protein LC55x_3755 [Lysobacter capsici]